MGDKQNKAEEYRRHALACVEAAYKITLYDDRQHAVEMAEQWLALAKKAEAEERR